MKIDNNANTSINQLGRNNSKNLLKKYSATLHSLLFKSSKL